MDRDIESFDDFLEGSLRVKGDSCACEGLAADSTGSHFGLLKEVFGLDVSGQDILLYC